jgi:hypothetical protein
MGRIENTFDARKKEMMTGKTLIAWAVEKCHVDGVPPLDCNVLMYIRSCDDVNVVLNKAVQDYNFRASALRTKLAEKYK